MNAVDFDMTAMIPNNAVGQRHTQSAAFAWLFGGHKWLEYAFADFFAHPVTVISQLHLNVRIIFLGKNMDDAFRSAGIVGITQNIDEHLAQSLSVALHFNLVITVDCDVHRPTRS